jgi:cytoskeleton protein RodZ
MASTGSFLRELRERHGVSLEELARTTRIGRRFLEALEADDFSSLPSGPFAKGFIRAYCQALNEPADEALARYTATTAPSVPSPAREVPPPRESSRRAPVFVSLALLIALGAALTGVTLALRAGRGGEDAQRPSNTPQRAPSSRPGEAPVRLAPPASPPPYSGPTRPPPPPPSATAPPVAEPVPSAPSSPSATVPAPPGVAPPFVASTGTPYRLVARASDPTWIRVRLEGGRTIEETIPAGEVREWVSNYPFELRIGNAGGVVLELNGQVLPPLGARGAVITRLVLPSESR